MKTKFPLLTVAILLAMGCGNKMLKEAEKEYDNEQFVSAAKIYENVVKENPDPTAMLHLADCYRHMNRHSDAETWYSKSINSSAATKDDKLHYAEVLKEEGKYDEAILMFDAYLKTSPNDMAAKNQRTSCSSGGEFEKADPFYAVQKTNFGFSGSCFSPAKFGNDILVTASVSNKIGVPVDNTSGNSYFDLYVVSRTGKEVIATNINETDGSSLPTVVTPLEGDVNSDLHEGPAVFSPLNNMIFFTRSTMVKNKKGQLKTGVSKDHDNHLELCTAELVNSKWTNIKSLPINNTEYSIGHPALSSDGKRLFFVSDMP
ncbi:MAG TPA: tetratricopeptide repeat protein, partial [Bacteroidia bacterium]|nr:tetratricopeptide repeat protein [Bacteroidia bacterium]